MVGAEVTLKVIALDMASMPISGATILFESVSNLTGGPDVRLTDANGCAEVTRVAGPVETDTLIVANEIPPGFIQDSINVTVVA